MKSTSTCIRGIWWTLAPSTTLQLFWGVVILTQYCSKYSNFSPDGSVLHTWRNGALDEIKRGMILRTWTHVDVQHHCVQNNITVDCHEKRLICYNGFNSHWEKKENKRPPVGTSKKASALPGWAISLFPEGNHQALQSHTLQSLAPIHETPTLQKACANPSWNNAHRISNLHESPAHELPHHHRKRWTYIQYILDHSFLSCAPPLVDLHNNV